jgi:hypothetical protein
MPVVSARSRLPIGAAAIPMVLSSDKPRASALTSSLLPTASLMKNLFCFPDLFILEQKQVHKPHLLLHCFGTMFR